MSKIIQGRELLCRKNKGVTIRRKSSLRRTRAVPGQIKFGRCPCQLRSPVFQLRKNGSLIEPASLP